MSSSKFFLVIGIDTVCKITDNEDELKKVLVIEQQPWRMVKHKIEIYQDHPLYSNLKIGDKLTADMYIISLDDFTVVYDNILRADFDKCLTCFAFFRKGCEHTCPDLLDWFHNSLKTSFKGQVKSVNDCLAMRLRSFD